MTNLVKTGEIIEKVLRKFMEEKFEREWVNLTDEELVMYSKQFNGISLVSEIEALLKEKNNG
jgi:hypothetical protein